MEFGSDNECVLPALRVRVNGSARAEFFMASVLRMTHKGLPVCNIADGRPASTQFDATQITEKFGKPTHYFLGGDDPCWLLDAQATARFKAESNRGYPIPPEDARQPRGGCFAASAHNSTQELNQELPDESRSGGGMLTHYIVLS